jgi:hypothetical protein
LDEDKKVTIRPDANALNEARDISYGWFGFAEIGLILKGIDYKTMQCITIAARWTCSC